LRFVVGALYAAVSAGFALLFGSGAGHGTDFFARLPLAPFSMQEGTFDNGGLLPLAGVLFWGAVASLAGASNSTARFGALALLGLHYFCVAALLSFDAPHQFLPGGLVLLAPYALGQVVLWAWAVVRFRSSRNPVGGVA
jgi:hypothetical protein